MFIKKFFHKFLIIIFFNSLFSCQLQDPTNTHGINFLKNRSDKLILDKSNINDVIKVIGAPQARSVTDNNEWYYFERTLSKGKFHELGRHVLKENNVLVLNFDKYGILKNKYLFDKNEKKEIEFSKKETFNDITKKSFVENFLKSIKQKMYGNK